MVIEPLQGTKPSLFDLSFDYPFETDILNMQAGVPAGTVFAMIGNQPIPKEQAQKVLEKLSQIFNKEFTLETVYVALEEDALKSEIATLRLRIEAEYESARRGIFGPSQGISQHRFITKRIENMGKAVETLHTLGGDQAVRELFDSWS
jgi:hypothetical protein